MSVAMGAGAAANVVGGIIQMIAAKKAAENMHGALGKELQQQGKFRNQAFDKFQPALINRGVESARTQIGQGKQHRQEQFQRVGQLGFGGQGPGQRDQAALGLAGQARAGLGGYSDWALNQAIANIRAQNELNRISDTAGGQAQIFPYKMQDAQHSMDWLASIGSIISSIGGSSPAWGNLAGGTPPIQQPGPSAPNVGFDVPQGYTNQFASYA